MRKIIIGALLMLFSVGYINAQSIVGKWKTMDDKTGKAKSIVEIYKKGDKYFGKIVKVLFDAPADICIPCKDDRKDKPIIGLEVIRDMELDDDEYEGGTIIDPEVGKVYKCIIKTNGTDKLDVRGYIGFSLIGRTQTWHKVN
ncbi:MAG: DUF2147 domain-containing protein [Flavobacteriales bacterium]